MVKQDDIAKMLNISRTTVARALNGKGAIKPETKKKILELCDELGYVKNPISTSLALKNDKNIFVFLVRGRNSYYTDTLKKGIKVCQKELSMYKFNMYIIETHIDYPEKQVEELLRVIKSKEVDGVIITSLLKEKIKKIKRDNPEIFFIALDLVIDKTTYNISSNYYKLGRIVGNVLLNSLETDDKVLLIDTDDDMISAKGSFNGVYDKLLEEEKCEIIGPIYHDNLENEYKEIIDNYLSKDIKAIYTSRFMYRIIEYIFEKEIYHLKLVTVGMSKELEKYIKEGRVLATITPDYYKMGYMSMLTMFDYLYKGIKPDKIKVEYESKIKVKENL